MKAKFENSAKVVGDVVKKDYKTENLNSPLGTLRLNANGSNVNFNFWEKVDKSNNQVLDVVKKTLNGVSDGEKYMIRGELSERLWEGNYQRQVVNRMISAEKIYNFDKVSEMSKELATAKLTGDIRELELELTNEVRGETVEEKTPKVTLELGIFSQYNPKEGKDDPNMTRQQVLINEINGYINSKNGEVDGKIRKIKEKVEDTTNTQKLHMLADRYAEAKGGGLFNLTTLHLVAYGDTAEKIGEDFNEGDNVTFGCDINTKVIVNEYDIVEGNLNEVEIGYVGQRHEKAKVDDFSTGGDFDDTGFSSPY